MSTGNSWQSHCYVDSDQALAEVCQELASSSQLGFDSEFIRTDTFFPKPGLYQLDDGGQTYLVDPLTIQDWAAFKQLFIDEKRIIVMHSCGEDLGLLRHSLDTLPGRLFDTQRAASFVGYDYSLSYQALVKAELGLELPKGETRSNWLRRPLAESQLEYAALDVEYLIELQARLTDKLIALERLPWFEADCQDMLNNVNDEWNRYGWESAYLSIGSTWQLDKRALALLQKLAYWREATARERDKPRNWIVKDQELLSLVARLSDKESPTTGDVADAGVFSARFLDRNARSIVDFIGRMHDFQQPADPEMLSKPLGGVERKQLKALQKLARELAEKLAISPELLARKRLWVELLENRQRGSEEFWPSGLNNWRRELLEAGVMKILAAGGS